MTTVYRRGSRGYRRKPTMRPVIQSYKKVLHFVNASFSAGFQSERIVIGVDSVAAGQLSNTDSQVPTGSVIKYMEVQFAVHNSVETPCFINCTLQYTLPGQTALDPNTVGGNNQRNQVLHMDLFSVGALQNSTHKFKQKIPKGMQRIREGTSWFITWRNSATVNREVQMIYKFYR